MQIPEKALKTPQTTSSLPFPACNAEHVCSHLFLWLIFLAEALQGSSAARKCFEFLTQQLINCRAVFWNAFNIWLTRGRLKERTIFSHWGTVQERPLPLAGSCCSQKHHQHDGCGTARGEKEKRKPKMVSYDHFSLITLPLIPCLWDII